MKRYGALLAAFYEWQSDPKNRDDPKFSGALRHGMNGLYILETHLLRLLAYITNKSRPSKGRSARAEEFTRRRCLIWLANRETDPEFKVYLEEVVKQLQSQ